MPCDTRLKTRNGKRQTIKERAGEVKNVVERTARQLAAGRVKIKIGAQGGVAFLGLTDEERDGVTDACMYRRIMATGSAAAKLAIQKAELLSGTAVNRQAVAQGVHSHDGGKTWHHGH